MVIAHRGFSGRYPENTLPAIRAAIRLGVDYVEVDVQETADGQLAVFHDNRLDRLCGRAGRVRDHTLAEIRRLKPAVPTLRQVLRVCRRRCRLLVEIKRADPARVLAAIGTSRNVVILARRPTFGAVRFALIAGRWPAKLPAGIRGVAVDRRLVTSPAVVRRLQRRGLQVFVWTVNRRSDLARFAAWGVDGLITNHPDRAKTCLARR
jgi:glycerophosphoryl diester phosphodiesterase